MERRDMAKLKYNCFKELFIAICDAIRSKTGGTEKIKHQDIPDAINSMIIDGPIIYCVERYPDDAQRYAGYARKAIMTGFNERYPVEAFRGFTGGIVSAYAWVEEVDLSQCECSEISYGMFRDCYELRTIIPPKNGITKIGDYAFSQAGKYASGGVDLDLTLAKSIGKRSFYMLEKTEITVGSVGNNVELIDSEAFFNAEIQTINIYISDDQTLFDGAPFGCSNQNVIINYYSATTGELISSVTPNAT